MEFDFENHEVVLIKQALRFLAGQCGPASTINDYARTGHRVACEYVRDQCNLLISDIETIAAGYQDGGEE